MNKRKKATSTAGARRQAKSGGRTRAPSRHATQAAVNVPPDLEKTPSQPVKPSTTLALAAECLIADAGSLKASLAALLEEPQPVTLDITALQRIDTAGLQVLTAFVRERARHARQVEWQGSAQVLATAAQLLGLTSFLKLPA